MIKTLTHAYKLWRLRRAQETHAYWKGRREMLVEQANTSHGMLVTHNSVFRHKLTHAAGMENRLAERVDFYLHHP